MPVKRARQSGAGDRVAADHRHRVIGAVGIAGEAAHHVTVTLQARPPSANPHSR